LLFYFYLEVSAVMYHDPPPNPPETARDVRSLIRFGLTKDFDIATPELAEYERLAQQNLDDTFPYTSVGQRQEYILVAQLRFNLFAACWAFASDKKQLCATALQLTRPFAPRMTRPLYATQMTWQERIRKRRAFARSNGAEDEDGDEEDFEAANKALSANIPLYVSSGDKNTIDSGLTSSSTFAEGYGGCVKLEPLPSRAH